MENKSIITKITIDSTPWRDNFPQLELRVNRDLDPLVRGKKVLALVATTEGETIETALNVVSVRAEPGGLIDNYIVFETVDGEFVLQSDELEIIE